MALKFDKVENSIVTDFVLNEALMILAKIAYEGRKWDKVECLVTSLWLRRISTKKPV